MPILSLECHKSSFFLCYVMLHLIVETVISKFLINSTEFLIGRNLIKTFQFERLPLYFRTRFDKSLQRLWQIVSLRKYLSTKNVIQKTILETNQDKIANIFNKILLFLAWILYERFSIDKERKLEDKAVNCDDQKW